MKSCVGSISIAFAVLWSANPPDVAARQSMDSLAYYPLQVGNEWHYEVMSTLGPRAQVIRIVGDSTFVSGRTYRKLMVKVYHDLDTDPEPSFRYERVDSASGIVYQFREDHIEDQAVLHLALSGMGQGEFFELQGTELPFLAHCDDNVRADVLGHQPLAKHCSFGGQMTDMSSYSLAYGIGVIAAQVQPHPEFTDDFFTLVYARVDGQVFGTPLATGKDEHQELPREPVLEVFPNPARDRITFSTASFFGPPYSGASSSTNVSLPGTGARLEIFDMLGRQVWHYNLYTGDGSNSDIRIDVSNWTPGGYFARIRTRTESATRLFVVNR